MCMKTYVHRMSIHPFQKVTNFAILIPKCVHLPHMSFQFESLNRPLSPRIEVRLHVNQALLHKSVSPLLELKSTDAASLPPILNPSSLGGVHLPVCPWVCMHGFLEKAKWGLVRPQDHRAVALVHLMSRIHWPR
jgi:hypothetical protein